MKYAIVTAVTLLVVWQGLRWLEQAMLYLPDKQLSLVPNTYGFPSEELHLTTEDGATIYGWYISADKASSNGKVLLLCHGNAGNISNRLEKAKLLRPLGLAVLLFDYRGYGRSAGTPSEQGTYRDAEAAYRFLVDKKGYRPDQIVIYGESLGCAVALELARRHPPAALILESPFTSILDMGKKIFPYLPLRWILRYHYDNLGKIGGLQCPLLIMHSPQDDVVPFEMGRRLFEAAPRPKTFFELRGSHNDGFLDAGDAYPKAVKDFLAGT